MSFLKYKDVADYGDTVMLYLGYDNMLQFRVEKGKTHQMKFGYLRHDDLVGVKFGSKIACSRGYVYLLHPTAELWTATLPHRTQIIYSTDISMILLQLDLSPGSVVIEAGTGSGSLSHSILRTIAPTGHLHTYDFHEQRANTARDEFASHGLNGLVTVTHRDICSIGFEVNDSTANAVFLDLPSPWLAIPFASKALVPGGRICSFSPCIEQVQRSCAALRDNGFSNFTTIECLRRAHEARTVAMSMPDLGYGPGNYFSLGETKPSRPIVGRVEVGSSDEQQLQSEANLQGSSDNESVLKTEDAVDSLQVAICNVAEAGNKTGCRERERMSSRKTASYVCKSSMASIHMTGHTGFLTFATRYL